MTTGSRGSGICCDLKARRGGGKERAAQTFLAIPSLGTCLGILGNSWQLCCDASAHVESSVGDGAFCRSALTAGTDAGPQLPPLPNHVGNGLDAVTAKTSSKTRQEVAKPFPPCIAK